MIEAVEWANATYHLQEAREPLDNLISITPPGEILDHLNACRNRLEEAIDLITLALEKDNE